MTSRLELLHAIWTLIFCRGCHTPASDGWDPHWACLLGSERVDMSLCASCYEGAHAPLAEVAQ